MSVCLSVCLSVCVYVCVCVCVCVCSQRLMSSKPGRAEQFVSANLASNKHKNRHATVLPCEFYHHALLYTVNIVLICQQHVQADTL